MISATKHIIGRSLAAVVTAALVAACDTGTTGPDRTSAMRLDVAASADESGDALRAVDLGTCDSLQPPAGTILVARMFAEGVQVYRWNGASWAFVAPSATLYADAAMTGVLGTHFAGPTWQSVSGGTVVGAASKRCTPDASAIPWLLLTATPDGPGIFEKVAFIQRLNTVGGIAPAQAGRFVGDRRAVPYTATYTFYRY